MRKQTFILAIALSFVGGFLRAQQATEKGQKYLEEVKSLPWESSSDYHYEIDTIESLVHGFQQIKATHHFDCNGDICSKDMSGLITPRSDTLCPVFHEVVVLKNGNLLLDGTIAVVIDKEMNVINAYSMVKPFKRGLGVFASLDSRLYGIMDEEGKEIVPPSYDYMENVDKWGRVAARKDLKWTIFNSNDLLRKEDEEDEWDLIWQISPTDILGVFDSSLRKYGIINEKGVMIKPYQYDDIEYISNGFVAVSKNGKWGLLSDVGDEITEFKYDKIHNTSSMTMIVQSNGLYGKYGLLNYKGIEIAPMIYSMISTDPLYSRKLETEYWIVKKHKAQWGLLNYEGKEITPMIYDKIDTSSWDEPKGLLNGKWVNLYD